MSLNSNIVLMAIGKSEVTDEKEQRENPRRWSSAYGTEGRNP